MHYAHINRILLELNHKYIKIKIINIEIFKLLQVYFNEKNINIKVNNINFELIMNE